MSVFDSRFLDCRDMGHAWERASDIVKERGDDGVLRFSRVLRCSRCTTMRRDEFVVGDVVKPKGRGYTYPKGYQVKGGLSRGEARLLLVYPKRTVKTA